MSVLLEGSKLEELKNVVWGLKQQINEPIFQRWAQGIKFSESEPSALVQFEGGPCAVIAPVQAFLLCNLMKKKDSEEWKKLNDLECRELLCLSLVQILSQTSSEGPFYVVTSNTYDIPMQSSSMLSDLPSEESLALPSKKVKLDHEHFHNNLKYIKLNNIDEVHAILRSELLFYKTTDSCGLLLFLYSLLLTKGLACVKKEMNDDVPLIDSTHGHGSQSLINLMITGHSTSYVWDGDKDLGGLSLHGVQQPSEIGFLSLLEHLRYVQVGNNLKSPKNPIWVLGSETHLTVLFSELRELVSDETQSEKARRIFQKFDPDGNGFINRSVLEEVLKSLDLVSDHDYIKLMEQKLDPESLGIIPLFTFMDEFFPRETNSTPDVFTLWHYNGLSLGSNSKVEYREGTAVLLETEVSCLSDSNSILTCLQTKWPSIDVRWTKGETPSIN